MALVFGQVHHPNTLPNIPRNSASRASISARISASGRGLTLDQHVSLADGVELVVQHLAVDLRARLRVEAGGLLLGHRQGRTRPAGWSGLVEAGLGA
jgi:hypothetical protein